MSNRLTLKQYLATRNFNSDKNHKNFMSPRYEINNGQKLEECNDRLNLIKIQLQKILGKGSKYQQIMNMIQGLYLEMKVRIYQALDKNSTTKNKDRSEKLKPFQNINKNLEYYLQKCSKQQFNVTQKLKRVTQGLNFPIKSEKNLNISYQQYRNPLEKNFQKKYKNNSPKTQILSNKQSELFQSFQYSKKGVQIMKPE